jgi:hypothetical protein
MPPRWLCVLIVASWLLLTGWLFYDDLLPRLLPGQPPPVTIDLVEEARTTRLAAAWRVYQDDRAVCTVRTKVEHPRRGLFEMTAEFPLAEAPAFAAAAVAPSDNALTSVVAAVVAARLCLSPPGSERRPGHLDVGPLEVLSLSSVYRVDADGDLLSFEVRLTAAPRALGELLETGAGNVSGTFGVTTNGEVRGGTLRLTRRWGMADGAPAAEPYAQLPIARGAAVVMPLHPPKRMRGVSPGQSWRAVLVDPFATALVGEPVVVRAKVRAATETVKWNRAEVPCLVIDYEGERAKVSTWVSAEDGTVLRQDATLDGGRWSMRRQ